jgi:hypothetical protein
MKLINFKVKFIITCLITYIIIQVNAFASLKIVYSNTAETFKAVIRLRGDYASCSGTVVGLNPPTVITARHCIDNYPTEFNARRFKSIEPEKIIYDEFKKNENVKIVQSSKTAGDIAVLIYPRSSKPTFLERMRESDLFTVSPNFPLDQFQRVQICGYGLSKPGRGGWPTGEQLCGFNNIIMKDKKLNFAREVKKFFLKNPKLRFDKLDEEFHKTIKVKFIHTFLQEQINHYPHDPRLAIGPLVFNDHSAKIGIFDEKHENSTPNAGDSGGPLFINNGSKKNLIGVYSEGLYIIDKGINVGNIFVNITSPLSLKLLERALNEGADIKGLMTKPNLVFEEVSLITSLKEGEVAPGVRGSVSLNVINRSDFPNKQGFNIKITENSDNLLFEQKEFNQVTLKAGEAIDARLNFKISDSALPGEQIFINGVITVPASESNHEEVVPFTIKKKLVINASVETEIKSSLKGITVTLSPNFSGTEVGYTVHLEELGSSYVHIKEKIKSTKTLKRDDKSKVRFHFKLNEGTKGKIINLRVIIKYKNEIVVLRDLELNPR